MRTVLLRGGTVYDGSGAAPFRADVLLREGRVAEVSAAIAAPPPDTETMDCAGLAVAPGFIDLHSHSDLQVLEADRREKIRQGVTMEVVGNCGFSPYPCGAHSEDLREFANGIFRGGREWRYASAREYLDDIARRSRHVAVESLAGHGSLRIALFGLRQDPLSETELQQLEGVLAEALAGGASGFCTRLRYAPGSSAGFDELVRLCRVTARAGRIYATHMRSYSFGLLEAVDEQLRLARASGCRLQISHLQAVGRVNWDKQRQALDRIEQARREGIDVEFDIYPYQAGSTVLTQLLPQAALDGGAAKMLARLRDPGERARIARDAVAAMAQRWSDVFITSVATPGNQDVVGRQLEEIGAARGVEPVEAAIDLILEEQGAVNIVSFNQSEENLRALLTHPLCTVISDGFYVNGRPHPRLYGTFPFLLGEIVRERRWMPLEEAVHKITAKPAARLGLAGRGLLRPGAMADVTVFDPAAVQGPASYEKPEQDPVGIRAVFRRGERAEA